ATTDKPILGFHWGRYLFRLVAFAQVAMTSKVLWADLFDSPEVAERGATLWEQIYRDRDEPPIRILAQEIGPCLDEAELLLEEPDFEIRIPNIGEIEPDVIPVSGAYRNDPESVHQAMSRNLCSECQIIYIAPNPKKGKCWRCNRDVWPSDLALAQQIGSDPEYQHYPYESESSDDGENEAVPAPEAEPQCTNDLPDFQVDEPEESEMSERLETFVMNIFATPTPRVFKDCHGVQRVIPFWATSPSSCRCGVCGLVYEPNNDEPQNSCPKCGSVVLSVAEQEANPLSAFGYSSAMIEMAKEKLEHNNSKFRDSMVKKAEAPTRAPGSPSGMSVTALYPDGASSVEAIGLASEEFLSSVHHGK
ncbi:MAG: hypothetical protein GY906_27580, partial [bacterium]|nr:hypothetical protein [bacterium]